MGGTAEKRNTWEIVQLLSSGRVEIKGGKAVIYLNPALNIQDMLAELTRLFGLDKVDFVRVKNDGSRHYRAYAP